MLYTGYVHLAGDVFWCSMSIVYFDSYHYRLILANNPWFKGLHSMNMLDIDYLVDSPIESAIWPHIGTVWCNTDMFHLKLLIILSLSITGSNWLGLKPTDPMFEAKRIFGLTPSRLSGLLCVNHIATFLCQKLHCCFLDVLTSLI